MLLFCLLCMYVWGICVPFLTPVMSRSIKTRAFSYQCSVSSAKQESSYTYSKEPTFALCVFKGLTVDSDSDCALFL